MGEGGWKIPGGRSCRPREVRVAPTTDQFELVGNPRAAARLDDGRILVVYERTNLADTSEVRIVVLNAQTGGRVDMCEQSSDLLLSQGYARHASVTAANFDRLGKHIVAAVAWSEGEGSATRAKYQLIAADLCPHTPAGVLLAPNVLGPTDDVSLTWSPQDAGVVATFQNSRSIHRSVIRGEAPEAATPIADGQLVISSYQSAFASDGRGLAAWFASDSTSEFLSNRRRLRVLLLDRGAVARKAAATGAATPFELAIPTPYQAPDLVNSLSLAVRDALACGSGDRRRARAPRRGLSSRGQSAGGVAVTGRSRHRRAALSERRASALHGHHVRRI